MSEPVKAWEFVEKAAEEMKRRKAVYDPDKDSDGERSMGRTVAMFNALTDHELTEEQGWMFMVCLKMVRSQSGKYQADDYVDGAAYVGLAGECASKERNDFDAVKELESDALICCACEVSLVGVPSMVEYEETDSGRVPRRFCEGCHSELFIEVESDSGRGSASKKVSIPGLPAKNRIGPCAKCFRHVSPDENYRIETTANGDKEQEYLYYHAHCAKELGLKPCAEDNPEHIKVGGTD